jgi:hypothetical protein
MLLKEINLAYYQDFMETMRRASRQAASMSFAIRRKRHGGPARQSRFA